MTRVLSQLLEAKEPEFRQTVQRLEKSSGNACNDIRLTEALHHLTREKIMALGLDPEDTTGEELYHALQAKLANDDAKLVKRLRTISAQHVSAEGNISDGIAYALTTASTDKHAFGLKNSVLRRFLLDNPPKRTMKIAGYRSIASMLKHEPVTLVVLFALSLEPATWLRSYKQLVRSASSRDCEDRLISVFSPSAERWREACYKLMSGLRQTVVVNKELASIIVFPLPSNDPKAGLTIATLTIGLDGLNSIHTAGSYLRLSQVVPDFGERLVRVSEDEPELGVSILKSPLSWETVQRFMHHMSGMVEQPLDLHVDFEEILGWQPVETMLSKLAPELEFWKGTEHLGRLDGHRPISLNLLDNALCLCNKRLYYDRIYHHLQRSLWQEFVLRYIRPDLLTEAISQELQPKLATELVSA